MNLEAIQGVASTYAPVEWLAIGTYVLAGQASLGLCVAVMSAMLEAMWPRWASRVWVAVKTGLSVALKSFCLVTVVILTTPAMASVLAVALCRLYKIHAGQVARIRWNARTHGRHRYSRVLAWTEGENTVRLPVSTRSRKG